MSAIPAGSIHGVNIERIRTLDAQAATEIELIGAAMKVGSETDAQFLRLCGLLISFGEMAKAEELLIANAEEGSPAEQLFHQSCPNARSEFDDAVQAFARQYSCELIPSAEKTYQLLDQIFRCKCHSRDHLDALATEGRRVMTFLTQHYCEVRISYERAGEVIADLIRVPDEGEAFTDSIPLYFRDGMWRVDYDIVLPKN
jgi:hypothetical protein